MVDMMAETTMTGTVTSAMATGHTEAEAGAVRVEVAVCEGWATAEHVVVVDEEAAVVV